MSDPSLEQTLSIHDRDTLELIEKDPIFSKKIYINAFGYYGYNVECINGNITLENVQIKKHVADLWDINTLTISLIIQSSREIFSYILNDSSESDDISRKLRSYSNEMGFEKTEDMIIDEGRIYDNIIWDYTDAKIHYDHLGYCVCCGPCFLCDLERKYLNTLDFIIRWVKNGRNNDLQYVIAVLLSNELSCGDYTGNIYKRKYINYNDIDTLCMTYESLTDEEKNKLLHRAKHFIEITKYCMIHIQTDNQKDFIFV